MMKSQKKTTKKNKFSFSALLDDTRFRLILSLVSAFALWMWVAIEKSPEIQTVITGVPVKINLENSLPQQLGLDIFGESEFTVDVTVTGKKYILSNLKSDDIVVEANTNYVDSPGAKSLPLKVSSKNDNGDFTITSFSENYIEVFFDTYKEVEFSLNGSVNTKLDSIVPEDCLQGDFVFSKNTVKVTGPTTEINRITGVSATVNIDKVIEKTTAFDPEISLVTNDNIKLNYAKIVTDIADITMTVPVLKVISLPTAVEFKNAPAHYIENPLSYTVSPSVVKVAVPVDIIDTIKYFVVDTIDFSDISNSHNTFNVSKDSINSYKIVDESVKNFRIRINASEFSQKTLSVPASNIKLNNNRNDFNVTLDNNHDFSVTVIGPAADLNNITADNIVIQVDTEEKTITQDTLSVGARVLVNNDSSCWAFGKYDVRVKVVKK